MSDKPTCRTCRYFVERANDTCLPRCHRNAPIRDVRGLAVWPMIMEDDWCGEYQCDPSVKLAAHRTLTVSSEGGNIV